jgi:hypothetical protein
MRTGSTVNFIDPQTLPDPINPKILTHQVPVGGRIIGVPVSEVKVGSNCASGTVITNSKTHRFEGSKAIVGRDAIRSNSEFRIPIQKTLSQKNAGTNAPAFSIYLN